MPVVKLLFSWKNLTNCKYTLVIDAFGSLPCDMGSFHMTDMLPAVTLLAPWTLIIHMLCPRGIFLLQDFLDGVQQ